MSRSVGAQRVLEDYCGFVMSSTNPRLDPAKLKLLEKLGKLLSCDKSFRRMSKRVFECLLGLEISFTELEVKKEQREQRKQEDYDLLRRLKKKRKLTFKQEQIIQSRGFHKRVKMDQYRPRDKETKTLERQIAKRNKQKKDQKFNKRLLETFYAVVLKIIRLHYKKPVVAVGLTGLMRFINRMPAKFVGQILVNLRSIYMLMEQEDAGVAGLARKLKMIRTMLSLWKKINFEDQLENHFLQGKLYQCFLVLLDASGSAGQAPHELVEDLYVNFDNLVMKARVSDSNVVCNWFVLLASLAAKNNDQKMVSTNLYLMNKMTEKYERLVYYFDDEGADSVRVARTLTTAEDKSVSLTRTLNNLHDSLGANNRAKHFVQCLVGKTPLGKKYIGMDLRAFLKIV